MSSMSSLQEQVRLYREYLQDSISSIGLDEKFEKLKEKVAIEYNRIVSEIKSKRVKVLSSKEPGIITERPTIEIPDETTKIKPLRMPESKIGSFFVANENFKPLPAKYQKRKVINESFKPKSD